VSMTRSWLWNFRGGQLLLFDKRVREIKNEVSIRHIFFRILYFCHMSRSISVSSLVRQDTMFLSLIDFFDNMLMCSFLRRWILTRLLLCGFVDINRHYATQSRGRSRSRCHGHGAVSHEWGAVCDRNLSHWISEKGPWRRL